MEGLPGHCQAFRFLPSPVTEAESPYLSLPGCDPTKVSYKSCPFLQVSAETLFGIVPNLIRAHRSFWEEVMQPILEETRTSGQPLDPVSLQNGFLTVSVGRPRKSRMRSAQKDPGGTTLKYNLISSIPSHKRDLLETLMK